MPRKNRNYNTNLVKGTLNYSTNEIADLFSVHKRTVQSWYGLGLLKIDDRKPFLVLGHELKRFLNEKKNRKKQKCMLNEMYCCKCRKPQKVRENVIDLHEVNEKTVLMKGLCSACNTKTNKLISKKQLPMIEGIFEIITADHNNLTESVSSNVNTDLREEFLE